MDRKHLLDLVKGVVLFCVYLVTAKLGLEVDAVSQFATLVWLPTGISLAFLLIFGLRFWPAIFAGAFLANFSTGAPALVALGIAVGNSLEALVGAYLLKRYVKLQPRLERVRDVVGLIIFAAAFSTLISATVGVSSLLLGGVIESSDYRSTWIAWWAGDMISDLVVAPFILVWSVRSAFKISKGVMAELLVLTAATVAMNSYIFSSGDIAAERPRPYLVFPPLIWAALRFGQRGAVTAVLFVSASAVWYTAHGHGTFAQGAVSQSLLGLDSFMVVVAATIMLLAAVTSERKRLEEKKDEFVSVASHELRTPLTTAKMLIQAMERQFAKNKDSRARTSLKQIDRQVEKITNLVLELFDVTKIKEGKMKLQKEKFKMGELIKEAVQEISGSTHHKFIVKGQLDTSLTADRNRIGQVLTNLISNSVKYSPKAEKIVIDVSTSRTHVTVGVKDFGKGIAKEEQQNIFDRFYQIDSSSSQSAKSLGLGLYIAKEIIDRHEGKIWVESNPPRSSTKSKKARGSTFYFKLPIAAS